MAKSLDELVIRDIPDAHMRKLRTFCGLKQDQEVSVTIRREYWRRKLVRDRGDASEFATNDWVEIALRAGQDEVRAIDLKAVSIIQLFREKKIFHGEPIKFVFRRQEVSGHLLGVKADGKTLLCQAIGSANVVELPEKDVRLDPAGQRKVVKVGAPEDVKATKPKPSAPAKAKKPSQRPRKPEPEEAEVV